MILILSEKYDNPTERIISELNSQNAAYQVICGEDFLRKDFSINLTTNIISFENFEFTDVNIIWYRRWLSRFFKFSEDAIENEYLKREFDELSSNFMLSLSSKKWLNIPPFITSFPSKAHQLKKAKDVGLNIPNTLVTNNKSSTQDFFSNNNKNIISKNLSDPYFSRQNNSDYATYTTMVEKSDIENQERSFFPSLFQNNISKKLEIRIFYFLKKIYSYAIFSSANTQTNVDFRVYDYGKPNRIMKYDVPICIHEKLVLLMEDFNLHTGSIDMILDLDNNFYFLEVNPQGQFGGLEDYDLYIEKDIAAYLIKNDI